MAINKAQFASMGVFGIALGVAAYAISKFMDTSDKPKEEKSKQDDSASKNKNLGKPKKVLTNETDYNTDESIESGAVEIEDPETKINAPAEVGEPE